jgi:hypothetical protein
VTPRFLSQVLAVWRRASKPVAKQQVFDFQDEGIARHEQETGEGSPAALHNNVVNEQRGRLALRTSAINFGSPAFLSAAGSCASLNPASGAKPAITAAQQAGMIAKAAHW